MSDDRPPYSDDAPAREHRFFLPAIVSAMVVTWAVILVALAVWVA